MKKTIFIFTFLFLSVLLWFYAPLPLENAVLQQDKNIQPLLITVLGYIQISVFLSMAQLVYDLNQD